MQYLIDKLKLGLFQGRVRWFVFEWQAGNGKRVTNKIFLTDAGHAQEPKGSEDVAQRGQEEAQEGDKQEVEVEVHHEEEVEGAVGWQELEEPENKDDEEEDKDEDELDKEDKEDDVIDKLVTSGHIKMVSKWASG